MAEQLNKGNNMVNGYLQNRQQTRFEVPIVSAEILVLKAKDLLKDKK